MEEELQEKLKAQDKKLEDIYRSVEKTRKYFLWTAIATVACFVLPLIGLMFAIPNMLDYYSQVQPNVRYLDILR
jgi:type IV secretory pathway component VirB8